MPSDNAQRKQNLAKFKRRATRIAVELVIAGFVLPLVAGVLRPPNMKKGRTLNVRPFHRSRIQAQNRTLTCGFVARKGWRRIRDWNS